LAADVVVDDALGVVGGVGGRGARPWSVGGGQSAGGVRIPAQFGGEAVYQVYRAGRVFRDAT
jgi:hypothetical protein